jgi:hypothetical protein
MHNKRVGIIPVLQTTGRCIKKEVSFELPVSAAAHCKSPKWLLRAFPLLSPHRLYYHPAEVKERIAG